MKVLLRILAVTVLLMAGAISLVNSQQSADHEQVSEAPFPVSEAIDLATYPLKLDPELGVSTARLGEGKAYQLEVTVVEIPAGGKVPPVRHLAEEYIYIVAGEGYTTMWRQAGEKPQRYEWKTGDLLSPSLNAWHQHFASSDTPARYVSLTTMPLSNNLFHNEQSLTGSDLMFEDRWQQGITLQPAYKATDTMDMRAGHYVPDLPGRNLQLVEGRWGMNLRPDEGDMAGNRLLEAFVREYRNDEDTGVPSHGDRHPWEKVYLGLEGEGIAILKPLDGPAKVVNWKKGELFFVDGYEHHEIGQRFGFAPKSPYPRIMQMKAPGYFDGIGTVGETEYTKVTKDDEIFVEVRE